MSRNTDLRAQYKEHGMARLPLPNDKDLTRVERQAGRQRCRSALVAAAFPRYRVTLRTTDTEVIATIAHDYYRDR